MSFGSSETDLWQVSDLSTVNNDIDGTGTTIANLNIYRDSVTPQKIY